MPEMVWGTLHSFGVLSAKISAFQPAGQIGLSGRRFEHDTSRRRRAGNPGRNSGADGTLTMSR
jgi:hypothetical protein